MVFPGKKTHNEKIFINYCRDDAGGFAGRLSDTLAAYFGRDRIFRDVTDIDYGQDFEQVIDQNLSESGAVVVLIGDKWTSVTNTQYPLPDRLFRLPVSTTPDQCGGSNERPWELRMSRSTPS